ncbi:MAG: UxaA family hydrolase [Mycobacteriales bacterium]
MTVLRLHADDDVGIARQALAAGDPVVDGVAARDAVPAGHKVALRDLPAGAPVHKYGQLIGYTTAPVAAGEHVHAHNLEFRAVGDREYEVGTAVVPVEPAPDLATFDGIVRPDGRVATRNYLGVLTSVNCSATVAKLIAARADRLLADFPHVDGVVALTHGTGCGMTAPGDGLAVLRRTLQGYARHPNFAGLVVVGLGCEVNQIADISFDTPTPIRTLTIQEAGGTAAAVRAGLAALEELLPAAEEGGRRQPVPASHLVLGLQCGGSDGYSGITANPALGVASDLLVRHGGTSILGETPEVYGAEHLLTRRAVSAEVADRLITRIRWWERYTAANQGSMDNNPSPGNKAGGLTTILEKSLGAVAKAGHSPLAEVVEYAEAVNGPGLVFMDTPGYDPVSVTGMVAGGANIIAFTTGRGSVFGCKPVPSLKLCTNTPTYDRMSEDMDVNCGRILDGTATLEEVGREIFQLLLDTASGHQTLSEQLGFGDEEFTPWQLGAVL